MRIAQAWCLRRNLREIDANARHLNSDETTCKEADLARTMQRWPVRNAPLKASTAQKETRFMLLMHKNGWTMQKPIKDRSTTGLCPYLSVIQPAMGEQIRAGTPFAMKTSPAPCELRP